jgi:hypothetical protein
MTREDIEKNISERIDETKSIVSKEALNGEFISSENLLIMRNQLAIMNALERLLWDNSL